MESIRKGIDYPGVCIVYLCHDGHGKLLMAKRSENARDENGRWDIGGGGLELHDTVEDTLKKEIMEEYCVEPLEYEFIGYRDVHRVHNGEKTHWIALDFKVRVERANVRIGEPHKFSEIAWFKPENLPAYMHSQLPYFFKKYEAVLKDL